MIQCGTCLNCVKINAARPTKSDDHTGIDRNKSPLFPNDNLHEHAAVLNKPVFFAPYI